jgi:ABC-type transporter Mla MlaB component
MLKIVRSENPDAVVFLLSGRIDQEHIAQLQAALEGETLAVQLDMREVTRVDREVVMTLARWSAQGILFVNCPTYLRSWIRRARYQKEH